MRVRGERVDPVSLKRARPIRGKLGVFVRTDAHRGGSVVCAALESDMVADFLLPALDHMRMTRMRGDSFVLVGFEEVQQRKMRDTYPQAWWCRVVCEVTGQSAAVADEEVDELASVF